MRQAYPPCRFLGIEKNMRAYIVYDPERKVVYGGVTGLRVRPGVDMTLKLTAAVKDKDHPDHFSASRYLRDMAKILFSSNPNPIMGILEMA